MLRSQFANPERRIVERIVPQEVHEEQAIVAGPTFEGYANQGGKCIVRHWGRHGSKGQKVVHVAWTGYQAIDEAWKLYYTKQDKGYVKDETTILDRLVREVE